MARQLELLQLSERLIVHTLKKQWEFRISEHQRRGGVTERRGRKPTQDSGVSSRLSSASSTASSNFTDPYACSSSSLTLSTEDIVQVLGDSPPVKVKFQQDKLGYLAVQQLSEGAPPTLTILKPTDQREANVPGTKRKYDSFCLYTDDSTIVLESYDLKGYFLGCTCSDIYPEPSMIKTTKGDRLVRWDKKPGSTSDAHLLCYLGQSTRNLYLCAEELQSGGYHFSVRPRSDAAGCHTCCGQLVIQ